MCRQRRVCGGGFDTCRCSARVPCTEKTYSVCRVSCPVTRWRSPRSHAVWAPWSSIGGSCAALRCLVDWIGGCLLTSNRSELGQFASLCQPPLRFSVLSILFCLESRTEGRARGKVFLAPPCARGPLGLRRRRRGGGVRHRRRHGDGPEAPEHGQQPSTPLREFDSLKADELYGSFDVKTGLRVDSTYFQF